MPATVSSAIDRVDYDLEERCLYVTFRSGRVYRYDGVPFELYERLLAADSTGSFFNRRIRDRFPDQRVTPGPERPSARRTEPTKASSR